MSALVDLRAAARASLPIAPLVPFMPDLQGPALATWSGRMKNEHASARVFACLANELERAGIDGADACREFSAEERRHGVLCASVVEALGGDARFVEEPLDYPEHDDVSPLEGALRSVLSVACLSETVAVALIGAERLAMPDGPLRELLEGILADEVGHARFGWRLLAAHVPTLDAAARHRLADYTAVALDALEAHELAHISEGRGYGCRGDALGLCDGDGARALFYATVREVIVPRLRGIGVLV